MMCIALCLEKVSHLMFVNNFGKYEPIFKIILSAGLIRKKILYVHCQVHEFARVWALRYGLSTSLSRTHA